MNGTALLCTTLLAGLLNVTLCSRKHSEGPGAPFPDNCYSGQLAVQGNCMNYTIKVLAGNMDSSRIQANWTDSITGINYTNVFALANPCDFPSSVMPGQTFFFRIDTARIQNCVTCQAVYPKPRKALTITVLNRSCR